MHRSATFFMFGSEIKALLIWPEVDRPPDFAAIDQFLTLQYVPAPRTAFGAISKLRYAHYMIIERTVPIGALVNRFLLAIARTASSEQSSVD